MTLFISDVHLGRGGDDADRESERALIRCLERHRDRVEHLYLLGDIFDEYIEYRHLVPKGFVRLKGLLAEWSDSGIPVTYLVGNHDPWHRDYFERELGVRIIHDDLSVRSSGKTLYLSHGDRFGNGSALRAWLKGWLRHPVPVWLYRTFLPGDAGMALARFVNRGFGTREVNQDLVERLRVHARRILHQSTADVVIFGHSHHPELLAWPEGDYLNTGYWHETRTFGRLHDGSLQLVRWNGTACEVVEEKLTAGP